MWTPPACACFRLRYTEEGLWKFCGFPHVYKSCGVDSQGVSMKRVLQPALRRGRVAEGAAILLLVALLTVLCVAVVQGVHALPS